MSLTYTMPYSLEHMDKVNSNRPDMVVKPVYSYSEIKYYIYDNIDNELYKKVTENNFYLRHKNDLYCYIETYNKYSDNLTGLYKYLEEKCKHYSASQQFNYVDDPNNEYGTLETIELYALDEPVIVYYDDDGNERDASELIGDHNTGLDSHLFRWKVGDVVDVKEYIE